MTFSFGQGGGIQDPHILRLLAELTTLIKKNNLDGHGASSPEVVDFIEDNKDVIMVDALTQCMYTFKEIAEPLSLMIQGLKISNEVPGDSWHKGQAEDMFDKKDPDEPADWWK